MPTPNPTLRREYRGAAAQTTLQNAMSSSDISFLLVSTNNWPTGSVGKFVVCINRGQADEEKILCDTQSSRTVACQLANRGFDGTTAQGHAAGATVECTISAFDADEWNQHTNATSGVHGVAGAVVGTTDTQTLTNKTFASPAFTGTVSTDIPSSGNVTGANLTNGVLNCTSSTRPGSPRTGQYIFETDTKSVYVYDGAAWQRLRYGPSDVDNTSFTPQASTAGTWTTSTATGRYKIVNGILHAWAYLVYASGGTNNNLDLFWNGIPAPGGSIATGTQVGTFTAIGVASGGILGRSGVTNSSSDGIYNGGGARVGFSPSSGQVVTYQLCYPVV